MKLRQLMFTMHMWIGLVLGIVLALLGVTGSLLVYDDALADLLAAPPRATTAGTPLPLTMIADTAREAASDKGVEDGPLQISIPQHPGDAVSVRVGQISAMGNMPGMNREGRQHRAGGEHPSRAQGAARGLQVFIDPVSGEVLGTRKALLPPILIFAHQFHGNLLLGRDGRPAVGWLGVAMLILGVSGLMLWWPKTGQWKYAFTIRRAATGLRFQRELHAATGIWIFLVFMAVSFSGVVIAWPQAFGMNQQGARAMPMVTPAGTKPIGATEALLAAQAAIPGLQATSITLPARPDMPISVNYLSNGAVNATAFIDPYRGRLLAVRDPSASFLAWMRPVHQGSLGAVWKFLVFLSGLAPALFVITGIIMWFKKRKRHLPQLAPLSPALDEELLA